jgi:hypothetical protein
LALSGCTWKRREYNKYQSIKNSSFCLDFRARDMDVKMICEVNTNLICSTVIIPYNEYCSFKIDALSYMTI